MAISKLRLAAKRSPSRHGRATSSATARTERICLCLGMMLITAFLFQAVIGLHWAWLFDLQEDFIFKQLSGLFLATFIAYQWRLNRARSRRMTRKAARLLGLHRIVGTLAPIFLYVHTQHWGHGYLNILTGVLSCRHRIRSGTRQNHRHEEPPVHQSLAVNSHRHGRTAAASARLPHPHRLYL
ncbi:MAG TPA: hypothetical protein ENJ68_07170 [Devosia sp.]|nr:hypothetical protein [Devosia sp.]